MPDFSVPLPKRKNNLKIILTLLGTLVFILILITGFFLYSSFKKNQEQSKKIQQSVELVKKLDRFSIPNHTTGSIPAFGCVVSKLLPKKIPLKDEYFSLFSVECEYFDVKNKKETILIPIAVTNGQEIIVHGFNKTEYHPYLETADEAFWLSQLKPLGFKGAGYILYPNIEQADPALGSYGSFQGFGAEVMKNYYSSENLQNFAQTGDPKYLNGILWTTDVGIINTLNNIKENELQNITPNP